MGKFTLLVVIVFLIVLGYFATLNKETITVTLSPGSIYETPKIALILLSSAAGAAVMLFIFFIRDTKHFIHNRQYQRRQKKDLKVQELYSKALNAILADNEEDARSALDSILQEDPGHFDALLRLGDIAAGDKNYQDAVSFYQKAVDVQPRNLEALLSLSRTLEGAGRESEALVYLDEILEIDNDNLAALYRKRDILEKKEEWDNLIELQKTIIKCEHNEKDRQSEQENLIGYKYEQGRFSLEENKHEKARKAFSTILRLDKDFLPAYLGLAETMIGEGENEEALSALEKAFEQTSSMTILARIEDLLINLGEPARLIKLYKHYISRDPQNQPLRFFMGKLYYRLEMLDDAFDTLMTVDQDNAAYPELHQLLGDIYLRRKQWDKAIGEFKKVIDIKMASRLPYTCSKCCHLSQEWSGRCQNCKEWNTLCFNFPGARQA